MENINQSSLPKGSNLKGYSSDDFTHTVIGEIICHDKIIENLFTTLARIFNEESNQKEIQDAIKLFQTNHKVCYAMQAYEILNDPSKKSNNDIFGQEKKKLSEILNTLIKGIIHTYLIDSGGYSIYGWSNDTIERSIEQWINKDYKNKKDKHPTVNISQWEEFYGFIVTLFHTFSHSFADSIIENSSIRYKQYIEHFVSDNYTELFSFSKDYLLQIIKEKFGIKHITRLLQEHSSEYNKIMEDELSAIVQNNDIKVNITALVKKYSIGNKNSTFLMHTKYELYKRLEYESILEQIKNTIVSNNNHLSYSSDSLIDYYFTLFSFFCGVQFHQILKQKYQEHIKEILTKALGTKINDVQKSKEQKAKKMRQPVVPTYKPSNHLPDKNNELSDEHKRVLLVIANQMKGNNLTPNIKKDIEGYLSEMIKKKHEINLSSWLKQKKYLIPETTIDIIEHTLLDYGLTIIRKEKIVKEENNGAGRKLSTTTNDNDDTNRYNEPSPVSKIYDGLVNLPGDTIYKKMISYFEIIGCTFQNKKSFLKELKKLQPDEIKPLIHQIKEQPLVHERVWHKDYKNGYWVMKFNIKNARIARKDNKIIGLYTNHDHRVSTIIPQIINNTL